ncbi:hypothetical protein [Rhizobium rhizogenes]|uniref:hypothetical protein n=1 Tax=Rhizobium rhizogenes TaxID=359 RepID=UPI0015D4FB53|nr:hypothetical protein [Rhizobium rhizogenes]
MPEKMKIYHKDGSSAEVDAVDGNRYIADFKDEWSAKPWSKTDADAAAKAKADADAKAKADADAKAKADADVAAAKAKADADAKAQS